MIVLFQRWDSFVSLNPRFKGWRQRISPLRIDPDHMPCSYRCRDLPVNTVPISRRAVNAFEEGGRLGGLVLPGSVERARKEW